MKIDILCVEGSPRNITPDDLYGVGIGGAEKSLVELSQKWGELGHFCDVYNDPVGKSNWGNVHYKPFNSFNPNDERDILITFRGPQNIANGAKYKKHIGFSTDQYTVNSYLSWYNTVDKMVLISEFHKQDHLRRYGSIVNDKGVVIDLGCNIDEYKPIPKNNDQCIFCSVPDRGLDRLYDLWPRILSQVPDAKLIITSSYGLWNRGSDEGNYHHRLKWINVPNVKFVSRVPRSELVKLQLQSDVQLYPCTYDENFCIANAECQVAGLYCVTSNQGALETTNMTDGKIDRRDDNFDNTFVERAVTFLKKSTPEKTEIQQEIRKKAIERFDWNNIINQWSEVIDA